MNLKNWWALMSWKLGHLFMGTRDGDAYGRTVVGCHGGRVKMLRQVGARISRGSAGTENILYVNNLKSGVGIYRLFHFQI